MTLLQIVRPFLLKYLELVNKAMKVFLKSAKKAKLKEINEWIETHIPKNKLYL